MRLKLDRATLGSFCGLDLMVGFLLLPPLSPLIRILEIMPREFPKCAGRLALCGPLVQGFHEMRDGTLVPQFSERVTCDHRWRYGTASIEFEIVQMRDDYVVGVRHLHRSEGSESDTPYVLRGILTELIRGVPRDKVTDRAPTDRLPLGRYRAESGLRGRTAQEARSS